MSQNLIQELAHAIVHLYHGISTSIGLVLFLGLISLPRILHIVRIYRNRPRNLPIFSKPYNPGKWLKNFEFILNGPKIILQAYQERGNASSFAILSLDEYQVLVCSEEDVKNLCTSTEETLSFHTAMTDRLKHKYTIFGFEYGDIDPTDSIPSRAIKVLLRMHLPILRPLIEARVKQGFELEVAKGEKIDDDWVSVSTFRFSKAVIEEANARVILGEELANIPDCVEAAIRYTGDAVIAAEISRQLPSILTPIIAPGIMRWSGAMKKLAGYIGPVVEERLRQEAIDSDSTKKYLDCIQWTIESSHTAAQRTTLRLIAQIIGILLASSHQMSMSLVYVMHTLCKHPEYIEPLREEIASVLRTNPVDPFKEMRLLDGFLLETARLNPPDALTVQRKVMKPITLSSGAYIPAGNLVAVPQQALSLDPSLFPDPTSFNPRRFLKKFEEQRETEAVTKFTDVSYAYPYWGNPRKACPGRWYVAHMIKQSIVHLLMNYDIQIEDKKKERYFFWTTAIVPRLDARILLRKRKQVKIDG